MRKTPVFPFLPGANLNQEMQEALSVAAQWEAEVISTDRETRFTVRFETDEEAELYARRVNQACSTIRATRSEIQSTYVTVANIPTD